MPAIANPQGARPYGAPSDSLDSPVSDGPLVSLRLRFRTARQRAQLTRALANGVDPGTRPELELRAAQLTSDRNRRAIARSLRRAIAEAHRPTITRARMVIVRRGAVFDAESEINAMIERLGSSAPVRVEGMAITERILANADSSPLYNWSEPGTLRREIMLAAAALDPAPSHSHEYSMAA